MTTGRLKGIQLFSGRTAGSIHGDLPQPEHPAAPHPRFPFVRHLTRFPSCFARALAFDSRYEVAGRFTANTAVQRTNFAAGPALLT